MTDTEILDYLQEAQTMRPAGTVDVQIGSVLFTLGLRPGTLREKLVDAIEEDRQRQVDRVTRKLTGETQAPKIDPHAAKVWSKHLYAATTKKPWIGP